MWQKKILLLTIFNFLLLKEAISLSGELNREELQCNLPQSVVDEISSYKEVTEKIINYFVNGPYKGQTYENIAEFVDTFGPRLSGSDALENSIDYMVLKSATEGLEVHTEDVEVPYWQRGEEYATMIQPRVKKIAILGLGRSVATPDDGITAEVLVVESFDELNKLKKDDVQGKILLYNEDFTTYGATNVYRYNGATAAAKMGAIASIVKSITPFSIASPHTGNQNYEDGVTPIPSAAITIEDAELIHRIVKRGLKVVLHLKMSGKLETRISRNTIVDLKGSDDVNKFVVVSGHIDSWDVGQGAMDDAGGVMISWGAPATLKQLGLTPKRTLRAIFWTAEEIGIVGGDAYINRHQSDIDKFNFVMESDFGTFAPRGLQVKGNNEALCIVTEILNLFKNINATQLTVSNSPGPDLGRWTSQGVPGAGLSTANERYFWFHHTDGDTMTVENSEDLDLTAAFWTAFSYVIADLSFDIPKELI